MMAQYRKSPYYYITYEYTDHIKDSVHVKRSIKPSDLIIKTDQKTDKVTANVIEVIENSARTKHSQFELKVESDQTIVSDRKSTRLNSSHVAISYAVFCLKKKKNKRKNVQHKDGT